MAVGDAEERCHSKPQGKPQVLARKDGGLDGDSGRVDPNPQTRTVAQGVTESNAPTDPRSIL